VTRAVDAAASTQVDELHGSRLEPLVAANRVTPVRVATVHDHVTGLEHADEVIEQRIHRGTGRDVEKDGSGRGQLLPEVFEATRLDHPGLLQLASQTGRIEAHDLHALLTRLQGESPSHPAEAYHAELTAHSNHGSAPFELTISPRLRESDHLPDARPGPEEQILEVLRWMAAGDEGAQRRRPALVERAQVVTVKSPVKRKSWRPSGTRPAQRVRARTVDGGDDKIPGVPRSSAVVDVQSITATASISIRAPGIARPAT
jgi:hypothetical protein